GGRAATVQSGKRHLRPGGWIALTEIDDLFGHQPLSPEAKSVFAAYAVEALAAKRYDFHMGRKLRPALKQCGFSVTKELRLLDEELSFTGPARPEVIDAWRARLDRMKLVRDCAGPRLVGLRDELLQSLADPAHRSTATVYCCIGARDAP